MITAEHSAACINNILDEYNLSKEDFWKNPENFLMELKIILYEL